MDVGSHGPAIEAPHLRLKAGIAVGPRAELLGDVAARPMVHLGLPVLLEADDNAHMVLVTGPQPDQAGIGESSTHATTLPGLVDRQMAAVMLPRRAEVVAPRGPAAARQDLMPLDCCVLPCPENLRTQDARGHAPRWNR